MLSNTHNTENLALATRRQVGPSKASKPSGGFKKDKLFCTHCKITGHSFDNCFKVGNAEPPLCSHCNMTGHTSNRCYKLHGYPPGHKFFKGKFTDGSVHQASG